MVKIKVIHASKLLAAAAAVIALSLGITRPLTLALLAGALCLNPAVTAINASQLNVADACFLALALCLLAAALAARGHRLILPAAVCWGGGAALEQSMVAAGVSLLLLLSLRALLSVSYTHLTLPTILLV